MSNYLPRESLRALVIYLFFPTAESSQKWVNPQRGCGQAGRDAASPAAAPTQQNGVKTAIESLRALPKHYSG